MFSLSKSFKILLRTSVQGCLQYRYVIPLRRCYQQLKIKYSSLCRHNPLCGICGRLDLTSLLEHLPSLSLPPFCATSPDQNLFLLHHLVSPSAWRQSIKSQRYVAIVLFLFYRPNVFVDAVITRNWTTIDYSS